MIAKRQFVVWLLLALVAVSVLITVLVWESRRTRERFSSFLAGDPHLGTHVFQNKGCAYCHAVNGTGGHLGPDLGATRQPKASLNQLVTAMWNHAPAMWRHMQAQKLVYPDFDQEEMAHLFAYLYQIRYVDEPGDVSRGRQLFHAKGCEECEGRGVLGRLPIAEAMIVSPAIRRHIMAHSDTKEIERTACKEGMERMGDDGIRKALTGEATLQEILRVTRI